MGHCVDSLCNVQEWYEPHKNALMLLLVSVTRDEKGSTPLLVLWEKNDGHKFVGFRCNYTTLAANTANCGVRISEFLQLQR